MPTTDITVCRNRDNAGIRGRRVFKYTGPNPYATGGDSFTGANCSLGVIEYFPSAVVSDGTNCYVLWYNYATSKIMWFDMAGAEIANGTNLSTFTTRIEVAGKN